MSRCREPRSAASRVLARLFRQERLRTVAFRVSGVVTVPKSGFPTDQVYGPTLQSSLRLVTCGGPFDRAAGSYRDNVIVSADPVV